MAQNENSETTLSALGEAFAQVVKVAINEAVPQAIQDIYQPPDQGVARPLNVKEAANFCHCSVSSIYKKVASGEIPHFRQGNKLLFDADDLLQWLKTGRGCHENL